LLTPLGWKCAENMRAGDRVAVPAFIPSPAIPTDLPESVVLIVSALLAEGGCTCKRTSFTNMDTDIVRTVSNAVTDFDCILQPIKNKKGQYDIVGSKRGRGCNRVLTMTRNLGMRKLSRHKRIPSVIFSISSGLLAKFLGLFWSCDGFIERRCGAVKIALASEGMIDDLKHLLLRFGIVTRKRYKKSSYNGKFFDSWELSVRAQSFSNFIREIGPHLIGKRREHLQRVQKGTRKKPNDDAIPATQELKNMVLAVLSRSGGRWKDFWAWFGWKVKKHKSPGIRGLGFISSSAMIPRYRLAGFVAWALEKGVGGEDFDKLFWMCSDQIVWDTVVHIETIGKHQTYDLTVSGTHNFIAGGFIVHNSWAEVSLAEHFWRWGYKALIITMEMPVSKISRRIDSMFSKLPFGDFKCGRIDSTLEERYSNDLNNWKQAQIPLWVCGKGRVRTTQDLELLIEELHPDIVLIDGIYLMRPVVAGKSGTKWEKVSTIADDLQDITQRKLVPIIGTTQFNRKVKKKDVEAGAESLGFAYEIGQNADGLIGLFQSEEMRGSKEMLLRLFEHREGEPINLYINWDFSTMDFSQKAVVKDEDLKAVSGGEEDETITY